MYQCMLLVDNISGRFRSVSPCTSHINIDCPTRQNWLSWRVAMFSLDITQWPLLKQIRYTVKIQKNTVMILSFRTDRSGQTV